LPRTEEELMDVLGSETYERFKDAADILSAKKQGEDVASQILKAAALTDAMGATEAAGVKRVQRALASVGMPVRTTGVVDQATVSALNNIFAGWQDAPPKLRAGGLTARDVKSMLPSVEKYLARAVGEAQKFGDATKE
jgi:hypothetical protein